MRWSATPSLSYRGWNRAVWTAVIFFLLAFATSVVAAVSSADIINTDEYIRLHNTPSPDTNAERRLNRTVLAYITPWNGKGMEMVDEYADKIDLVSPVWYTILVSSTSSSTHEATYTLSGGPTSKKDAIWLERHLKDDSKVGIVPRFYLDGWEQKHYADLLSNPTNWQHLSKLITAEVQKRNYDGVVFESAATHLLFEPIQTLSSSLKSVSTKKRSLTVVLPPLRTRYSLGGQKVDRVQESQNRMIVQSIPQLAQVVDYFSIMTYDMSSAGGRTSAVSGKDFPVDSPLRGAKKGSLRQPGPNTSPKWIEENVKHVEEATIAAARVKQAKLKRNIEEQGQREEEDEVVERLKDPSNPFLYDDFTSQEELNENDHENDESEPLDDVALIRGKLLMGMPMYGYRYPIFWIDQSTGQGIVVSPPTTASQALELFSRSDASSNAALLPFLRGPGEPQTMDNMISILTDHDGIILDPKQDDAEAWFDYVQTVSQDSAAHGVRQGDQIYWRLYLPLPSSTSARLAVLDAKSDLELGVSLWELGQASRILLHDL